MAAVERGEAGSSGGSGGATSVGDADGLSSLSTTSSIPKRIPVGKRTVVCVGGFRLCEGEEITALLETLKTQHAGITKVYAVGSYANRGKIVFDTSDHMWGFMTRMKGTKISSPLADPTCPKDPSKPGNHFLWHSIDKYPEELAM